MPKTLYEVFTGEVLPETTWVSRMTLEQMYKRLDVLRLQLLQRQEILEEFKKRGIRLYME